MEQIINYWLQRGYTVEFKPILGARQVVAVKIHHCGNGVRIESTPKDALEVADAEMRLREERTVNEMRGELPSIDAARLLRPPTAE